MAKGSQNNNEAHAGNEHHPSPAADMSPLSAQTLSQIQQNLYRRRFRDPRTRYIIHDNTSPGYEWLLPGWLAEERHMNHGRVYRYYYDPSGRMYTTRQEVLLAWEESGLIVIDDG